LVGEAVTERASTLVTILLWTSWGRPILLSRAGDEEAQRIFRTHHDLSWPKLLPSTVPMR
jgi:hypothetical protein